MMTGAPRTPPVSFDDDPVGHPQMPSSFVTAEDE